MKISQLDIGNFGKLQNLSIKLSDKFNVIYGNNEDGKTTIMAFIKLMFYCSYGRSNDLNKNPLKKYTPWNGKKMYGSISFEHLGKHYRLERVFKANGFYGDIVLWDTDSGKKEKLTEKAEIGERFFGIGNAGFEKSTYIGQIGSISSVFASDKSDELTKRLSSLVTSGDEDISLNEVLIRLENAHKKYSARNKKGLLDLNQQKLSDMQSELEYKRRLEEQKNSLKNSYQATLKELKNSRVLYEQFKSHRKDTEIIMQLNEIKTEIKNKSILEELKNQLAERNRILNSGNVDIDNEFVNICNENIQQIKLLENNIAQYNKNLSDINPQSLISPELSVEELDNQLTDVLKSREEFQNKGSQLDKLESLKSATEENLLNINDFYNSQVKGDKTQPKNNYTKFILSGSFIFVLFIILGTIISKLFFILSIAGLTAVVYSLISLKNIGHTPQDNSILKKYETQISETETQLENYQNQINNLKVSLGSQSIEDINLNIKYLNNQKKLIENSERENSIKLISKQEYTTKIKSLNSELANITNQLFKMFGEYKEVETVEEISSQLNFLKSVMEEKRLIEDKINLYQSAENKHFLNSSLGELLSLQNSLELTLSKTPNKLDISTENGETLENNFQKLNELATQQATEIKTRFKESDNIGSFENKISELENKILEQKFQYDSIKLAEEAINEAKSEIKSGFSPALRKETGKILSLMTNGKYNRVIISDNFDISVFDTQSATFKNWQYLSNGTGDQLYFAFRLAVAVMTSSPENPLPLFLDDVFIQYDDNRIKQAMEFLNIYQNSNQIIFLTCHKNILETAKSSIENSSFYSL